MCVFKKETAPWFGNVRGGNIVKIDVNTLFMQSTFITSQDASENEVGLFSDYFNINGWFVFGFITTVWLLAYYAQQEWVLTEEVYYNSLGSQMAYERISDYLALLERISWVSYLMLPILLLLQVSLVAFTLNVGALVADYQISYGKLFGISLRAAAVFAIAFVVRVGILLVLGVEHTDDIIRLDYFSLLSWVQHLVPQWLWYPVGLFNVFELCFVLALAAGIKQVLSLAYLRSLWFTLYSYGTGLLIWSMLLVFLNLTLS